MVDTSLAFVQPAGSGGAPAFRLLVPIREYIDKRAPHLADDVLDSLLSWVDEVALDTEQMRYTMEYALRSNPTPRQISNLIDMAWHFLHIVHMPSFMTFGGMPQDLVRKLMDLSAHMSDHNHRNMTACKMLLAFENLETDVNTEPFEVYLSTFVQLGDVQKQAECLMLRGLGHCEMLRRFDLSAIEDFDRALQVNLFAVRSLDPVT